MSGAKKGSFTIGTFWGVPVILHWSFPMGGLLISFIFRASLAESLYLCAGYTVLIALHEAGHAVVARVFGLKVSAIELSGAGGLCRHEPPRSFGAALLLCSAGLLAQALLLVGTLAYVLYAGEPVSMASRSLVAVFTLVNAVLLVINLVPVKKRYENFGTDGYLLWRLISNRIRGRPFGYPDTSATFPPETKLVHLDGFTPPGFVSGIEILNDNTTPMEVVVGALATCLPQSREEAIRLMLDIHAKGGLIIPLEPYEHAIAVAAEISSYALGKGHALVCRPVVAACGP